MPVTPECEVIGVKALDGHRLWIRMADGSEAQVDLTDWSHNCNPLFARLKDPMEFQRVHITSGMVAWGSEQNGDDIELPPERVYEWVTGNKWEWRPLAARIRAVEVEARDGFYLWVKFSDGTGGIVDCRPLLEHYPYDPLNNRNVFEKAHVDGTGRIVWDESLRLAIWDDYAYRQITGRTLDEARKMPLEEPKRLVAAVVS